MKKIRVSLIKTIIASNQILKACETTLEPANSRHYSPSFCAAESLAAQPKFRDMDFLPYVVFAIFRGARQKIPASQSRLALVPGQHNEAIQGIDGCQAW